MLKNLLGGSTAELAPYHGKLLAILQAVSRRNASIYEATMAEQLPRLVRPTEEQLNPLCALFVQDDRTWHWVTDAGRTGVEQLLAPPRVLELPADGIARAVVLAPLRDLIVAAFTRAPLSIQSGMMAAIADRTPFICPALARYATAKGFRGGEAIGNALIAPAASDLSSAQIEKLLDSIVANIQLAHASGTEEILMLVRAAHPEADWIGFLEHIDSMNASYAYPRLRAAAGLPPDTS